MSKKLFGLLCFQLFSFTLFSQNVTVLDAFSGEPIEAVTLNSNHPKIATVTNSKGEATLTDFKDAKKIYIRCLGFETQIISYNQIEKNNFTLYLNPENTSLNEVIISTSKWQETKKSIPNSIVTFKMKDIQLMNPQTSADLLNNTGKVFVQKSQLGGGSPMIRGFATNRVLLNVDGIRMNNAIFRSGNIQNVVSIDANSIQNTEVILGPGTVIYGSDAIGGVMNFYTFEPEYAKEHPFYSGNALSRWSSANNEKTIHFDLNVGTSKWAFVTSATVSDYEDLRMGKHGPRAYTRPDFVQTIDNVDEIQTNNNPNIQVETGYSQINLLQKIAFKPNEYWNFIYAFHYSTTSDFNRYDQLLRRRNDVLRFAEWYYGPQEWTMHHLKISHSKPNKWFDKAQFNASYQLFEESRHNRNLNATLRNSNIENVGAFSSNFDFIKKINDKHKLSYGVEYIHNKVNSEGFQTSLLTDEREAIPSRYPDGSNWQSLATYLQYENKINQKFTFQSGFRFNQIWLDATFDSSFVDYPFEKTTINTSAFTGSLGFTYLATDKTALFFNTGTAFRSPNIDDIGKTYESTPGNVVVPNANLEYEYAYNFEVGILQKIAQSVALDLTGFYTIVEDALVRRNFTFNGATTIIFQGEESNVQAIQNAAKANVYGIQAGLNIELSPILNWKTNANWTKGEEELDNGNKAPLRHAAPFFGDSRLQLKTRNWTTDLSVIYNSKIKSKNLAPSEIEKEYLYALDSNGQPYVPSWYTINLKALYKLDKNWSFSGGIENITDQRYRPYSSGITAAGRNLILAVRTSF
ncbi:TonB-dependent receptor [Flavobacterium orientale]|uniref:Hemoglobin/transferrin/lactoferrin receptor protein n=1 Tax=Flavobacterium orientale TaxID=1756020 RepID=A0A916Y1I7_9FLAO|nr:TonB-dependent receptor [Flavobacterium orientale]GGD26903.1 hypothetical protein GCM10011343_16410 [Flavobacterium orientale]